MALQLRTVPAARGLQWLRDGWRVFARKPLAFTGLFAMFLFAALAAMLIPWVGPLALLASMPLLTLGFMIGTREALADRFPTPAVFVVPLRGQPKRRIALLKLGIGYAIATVVIIVLADAIDGGVFAELQAQLASRDQDSARVDELLADPRLPTGLIVRFGLAALLSVPYWHAPALAYWGGQPAAQSLFSSTRSRCTSWAGSCWSPASRCSPACCSGCSACARQSRFSRCPRGSPSRRRSTHRCGSPSPIALPTAARSRARERAGLTPPA
jgi:hypothetical protein